MFIVSAKQKSLKSFEAMKFVVDEIKTLFEVLRFFARNAADARQPSPNHNFI